MQFIFEIALICLCIANAVLGVYVLIKKIKSKYSLSFFFMSTGITIWVMSNFLFQKDFSINVTYFFDVLANFGVLYVITGLYFFSKRFPIPIPTKNEKFYNIVDKIVLIILVILSVIVLFFPTLIDKGIIVNSNGTRSLDPAPLKILLFSFLVIQMFFILRNFYVALKRLKGLFRFQIKIFLYSVLFAAAGGFFFNMIFAFVLNNYDFVALGPAFVVAVSFASAYCMITYRYADFRVIFSLILEILSSSLILLIGEILLFLFSENFSAPNEKLLMFFTLSILYFLLFSYFYIRIKENSNQKYFFAPNFSSKVIDFERNSLSLTTRDQIIKEFKDILINNINIDTLDLVIEGKIYSQNQIINENEFLENISKPFKLKNSDLFILDEEKKYLYENGQEKELVEMLELISTNYEYDLIVKLEYLENIQGYILIKPAPKKIAFSNYEIQFLSQLSHLFSTLVYRIDLYEKNLELNKILQKKVDEATEELRKQKEEVEDRYRTERDMMGIMGHELRTPLTTARGFLEIIMTKAKNNPQQPIETFNHYLDNIFEAFKREIDLVQTMLSTSHVDNNKMKLDLVEVDLEGIIKGTMQDFASDATKKGLDLEYHPAENLPHIKSDPSRTIEVTNNLVSNAIKYTEKGRVDVYVSYDDQFIYFSVKDTGRGIPKDEIQNIGKKFYRVQNYTSEAQNIVRPGGTGLGMYIVKAILAASGGELRIESEIGVGSTFTAVFVRWKE